MYPRWLWPAFALPGVVWLVLLFLVPFYAVIGVAFGSVDPILLQAQPAWNPLDWNIGWFSQVLGELTPGGAYWTVFVRTVEYVVVSHRRLLPDRLSGGVLHRPPRRPHASAAPDPADPAVLDQLPDADAGLGQPARRPTATSTAS